MKLELTIDTASKTFQRTFTGALLLTAAICFATAAYSWTEPSSSPPGSNVAAPVNTGSVSQVKSGSLGVDTLAVYGNTGITGAIIANGVGTIRDANGGWVRTYGTTGWYNGTYGGGWYMADTSWLRSYSNKSIYTGGQVRGDSGICIGGSCKSSWNTMGGSYWTGWHYIASGWPAIYCNSGSVMTGIQFREDNGDYRIDYAQLLCTYQAP